MLAHYIIFHPENQRQRYLATATAMINNIPHQNWIGDIYVDRINVGNEDPFVFNNPWIYSFCHATQLRKKSNASKSYIQQGSWLLFACYQDLNNGILKFDTIFLVDKIHPWIHQPALTLPFKYQYLITNRGSSLWRRHFRFPFQGQHASVKYTFEAKIWQQNVSDYSFLPYTLNGDRVSLQISQLPPPISAKIYGNLYGKRPVVFNTNEISQVLSAINQLARIKVLRDII